MEQLEREHNVTESLTRLHEEGEIARWLDSGLFHHHGSIPISFLILSTLNTTHRLVLSTHVILKSDGC